MNAKNKMAILRLLCVSVDRNKATIIVIVRMHGHATAAWLRLQTNSLFCLLLGAIGRNKILKSMCGQRCPGRALAKAKLIQSQNGKEIGTTCSRFPGAGRTDDDQRITHMHVYMLASQN